ncbi:MAG: glycosyltransferase family 4 protein [Verrucomicrobia bacterium]|nr:glycosyltransferase family 4 protein [Verrucomicrobiota bacterium]
MKITIVSGFFLPVPTVAGGAMEKIWHRLAREFAAAGHEVTYFSRRWPGFANEERLDGFRMFRLPGFTHTRSLPRNLLLDLIWGTRVFRRLPPADIVVLNTVALPVWLPRLKPAAGRVVTVLGRMPKGQCRLYGGVHRVVATSEAVRAQVRRENPRLEARTRVVPNPIDWSLHQRDRRAASPLTIGYVGRINPEKGLELLLGAAARLARRTDLPDWRLRLVGPQTVAEGGGGADYVAGLRALAADAGERITFSAPIYDPAKLADVYASFDVFCYPSLAAKGEGLSVAPIEAMAAGAVPVVSALDCYDDVIRHGANGLVFDHRADDCVEQLADGLAGLLADAGRRRRLADQARQDARAFDYGVVARWFLDDFATLAAGRR